MNGVVEEGPVSSTTFACDEMPRLIVLDMLCMLPADLREVFEHHLATCDLCAGKRQALITAVESHAIRGK